MIRSIILFFIFSSILLSMNPGDEIRFKGEYIPDFFAEFLDAEIYSQNTIYILGVGGFVFIDVSDPVQPFFRSRYSPASIFKRFYNGIAKNNTGLAAARLDGLYILDLENLNTPSLASIHSENSFSYESADFKDSIAYAAVHQDGIEIIDISDPSAPVSIRTRNDGGNIWDVIIHDSLLIAANGNTGIRIYSIAKPLSPVLLSSFPTSGHAYEVEFNSGYIFVALGAAGFDIIDISDPENPYLLSNFSHRFGILNHLDVENNYVHIATWEQVMAVDISNPYNPVITATEDTPYRAMGIAARDSLLFVTDWFNLQIYSFSDGLQPDIHVKPNVYDFGFPGENIPSVNIFDIYNLGETVLQISDISVNSNLFTVSPTNMTIMPGEKNSVSVTYQSDQQQSIFKQLKFITNDPDEIEKKVGIYAGSTRPVPGKPAPNFTLNDIDGNEHSLSDYRGKVVILSLFASW